MTIDINEPTRLEYELVSGDIPVFWTESTLDCPRCFVIIIPTCDWCMCVTQRPGSVVIGMLAGDW